MSNQNDLEQPNDLTTPFMVEEPSEPIENAEIERSRAYNFPLSELSLSQKLRIARDHLFAIIPLGAAGLTQECIWVINVSFMSQYCTA